MGGNLYEWVADWYDRNYYEQSPDANPAGPAVGSHRVLRGGSWASSGVYTRAAYRFHADPDEATDIFGFRCAQSANP
jgi:formylglycine-generating enzyme required for sulfatase activity